MVMEVVDRGDDAGWGVERNLPRCRINVISKRPPSYVVVVIVVVVIIVVVMFVLPKFVLLFRRSRFSANARTRKFRMSTQACLVVIPMRPVGGNPTLLARSNFSYLWPNVRRTDGRTDSRTDKRDGRHAAGQIFRPNMPLLELLDGNRPTDE